VSGTIANCRIATNEDNSFCNCVYDDFEDERFVEDVAGMEPELGVIASA
jgi:hypothetical protein